MSTQVTTTEQSPALPALTPEGERFALRQRQAKMFAMSPLVPEHLRKGSPEQAIANCWIALTMAEAMGEQPLILMQNIHVVSGKAGFAAQYMIARANASGVFKGRIDWDVDRNDKENLAVTAYAYLADNGDRVEFTVDMKMATAEGWTKNPKYASIPELMLRYRSATFLVRLYAPDVMLGYQTVEEVEDVVAATTPDKEPLTSKMLLEQAKPTEDAPVETAEDAVEVHLEAIEERVEESEAVHEPAAAEPEVPEVEAEEEPRPAQPKADDIIAEIKAAPAIIDVSSIVSRHQVDIDAMPEEIAEAINGAAEARKREIKAQREKAPAQGELA